MRLRIVLVRSWLHKLEPIRAALRAAGFAPTFLRIDIEPALHAALTRGDLDLVIYDPELEGLSGPTVAARCKAVRPGVPCIAIGELDDLGARIAAVLKPLRN